MEMENQKRRGPKLKGDIPRKRYNVSLNPEIAEKAKEMAENEGETFSGLIENLLQQSLQSRDRL